MKTVNFIEAIKAAKAGKRIRINGANAWLEASYAFVNNWCVTDILADWQIEEKPQVVEIGGPRWHRYSTKNGATFVLRF